MVVRIDRWVCEDYCFLANTTIARIMIRILPVSRIAFVHDELFDVKNAIDYVNHVRSNLR